MQALVENQVLDKIVKTSMALKFDEDDYFATWSYSPTQSIGGSDPLDQPQKNNLQSNQLLYK